MQDIARLSSISFGAQAVSSGCQDAALSSSHTADHQNNTARGPQVPSGLYDALGNPISEQEYVRQTQYEQETGLPAVRDREDGRRRKDMLPFIKLYSAETCIGEHDKHITNPSICVINESGHSVFVESMSSLCKVTRFDDTACSEGAETWLDGLGGANGCYTWIDGFNSIMVNCADKLPL